MSGFAGKQILFIGIGFYDYEASIVARLESCGATVQASYDRPGALRRGPLAPFLRRAGIRASHLVRAHEQHILRRAGSVVFDFVLIIKGVNLRTEFLDALRRQQPRAQFILYLWDSMARLPGIEHRLPYFDRVLTFDRQEFKAHPGLEFRPLFYRQDTADDGPQNRSADPIDLCFVGWLHTDRLKMVRRLQSLAARDGMSFFAYLYTGVATCLKLALVGERRDVHFTPLPYRKLMDINARARVIIDLPHAAQSGMTMRAIEAIGLGRKLITTARDVIHYDFFDSRNIQVLGVDDTHLDGEFIRAPALPLPEPIRRHYSLDAWLEDVFQIGFSSGLSRAEAYPQH